MTPPYEYYREPGRWVHTDDHMFSELEVGYLKATLT